MPRGARNYRLFFKADTGGAALFLPADPGRQIRFLPIYVSVECAVLRIAANPPRLRRYSADDLATIGPILCWLPPLFDSAQDMFCDRDPHLHLNNCCDLSHYRASIRYCVNL